MALDFGSSAGQLGTSLIGAGLGLGSQFANGNLAPGAQTGQINQTTQMPGWMTQQWQNVFGQQNAAAGRSANQAIAGFTPAQQQAMSGIQGAVGFGMPSLQTAQNNAQGFANGIGQQQIQNFMNPFTQSAVQATLAQMQQQQGQQDAAISGQASQANAFGGDRAAVAQALNDQGWQQAMGSTISNLNNQGYQSAVNSALANQQAAMSGNQQFQNAILNNIGANTAQYQNLLGVGNQQQAQNQQIANYPITQAQIMAQNLNPNVGRNVSGYNNFGTMQNPITGAITGLNSGLQLGNSLSGILQGLNGGIQGYNQSGLSSGALGGLSQAFGGAASNIWGGPSANDMSSPGAYAGYTPQAIDQTQNIDNLFGNDYPSSFNAAGGEAANDGMTASGAQSYQAPQEFAGFSTAPPLQDPGMSNTNAIGYDAPLSGGALSQIGQGLGTANSVMSLYNGLRRGGVAGYGGAALAAGNLYNRLSGGTAIPGLGLGANVLGLYNGIKQGGVLGYGNAVLSGAQLAGGAANLGLMGTGAAASELGTIGAAAGVAGAALAPFIMAGARGTSSMPLSQQEGIINTIQQGPGSNPNSLQAAQYNQALFAARYAMNGEGIGGYGGDHPDQALIAYDQQNGLAPIQFAATAAGVGSGRRQLQR